MTTSRSVSEDIRHTFQINGRGGGVEARLRSWVTGTHRSWEGWIDHCEYICVAECHSVPDTSIHAIPFCKVIPWYGPVYYMWSGMTG